MADPKRGEQWEGVPTVRKSADRGDGDGLSLQVIADAYTTSFALPAAGQVVIGRADRADVFIDDPSISRRHAALHVSEAALELEDLGSANGTRVRGQALREGERATVAAGEAIELGDVLVVVQRRAASGSGRRLWSHEAFEEALEHACERKNASFAVARLRFDEPSQAGAVQAALAEVARKTDVIGAYGPCELEVLLPDATAAEAQRRMNGLLTVLSTQGVPVRFGVAHHPEDGLDAQALLAKARGPAEPKARPTGELPMLVASPVMAQVAALVEKVAKSELSVLVLGETGAGKERVAELVHQRSARAKGPLLRLSAAALSETLLESELFGHEKGAFTGAMAAKPGLLESAQGGTVFLDEIGELPLSTQAKLLRVLEQREVLRVGALKPRAIDVRFVSATNRDLEAESAAGRFRQDLYFRLNGVTVTIPPLRERRAEILPLAKSFIGAAEPALSPEAAALLERYRWPGNVRELRNVIERAVLLSDGKLITAEHLPVDKMTASEPQAAAGPPKALSPELEAERQSIVDALASCAGNQTHAARKLGISRGTLLIKMDAFQIPRPRKKLPFAP